MCELEKLPNKIIWKTRINSYQSFLEFLSSYWMKQLPYGVRLQNYLTWVLLFESDTCIGYITDDAPKAKIVIENFCDSIESLPEILRPTFYKKYKYDFQLQNKNSLHMIHNRSSVLGKRFSHIIVDDYDQYKIFAKELTPNLISNGKIITRYNFDDVVCGDEKERDEFVKNMVLTKIPLNVFQSDWTYYGR